MTNFNRILAVLALAAAAGGATVGLSGSSASAAGDCQAGSDWGVVRGDLASQTVVLVNAHRAALGLRQLVIVPALQGSAVWKARHMAKYSYMAHDDPAPPVARSAGERMAACGYTSGWGENIAYGYATATSVVSGWLNSPGHRANIENPSYVGIGAAAATSSAGQVFWAHTFGTSTQGVAPAPAPAPAPTPSPPPPPTSPAPTPPPPPKTPPPPTTPPASPAPRAQPPTQTPTVSAAQPPASNVVATSALTLRGLTLQPRRPKAGGLLRSRVLATSAASPLKSGHVFCAARLAGRRLEVVERRLENGTAVCVWRLPDAATGQTVSAVVIVQHGRRQVDAAFRATIS